MDSRFSWLYSSTLRAKRPLWDSVILESEWAKTIPTLGSLVPGWILTFGARPTLNLAALDRAERKGLLNQAAQASKTVTRFGGRIFQFEHGASFRSSPLGCGLDLAHLHTVPLNFDLISVALDHSDSAICWQEATGEEDPWRIPKEQEYLLVREIENGRTFVGIVHEPMSQFFRKMIAVGLGTPEEWDYREHGGVANVAATLRAFAQHDSQI